MISLNLILSFYILLCVSIPRNSYPPGFDQKEYQYVDPSLQIIPDAGTLQLLFEQTMYPVYVNWPVAYMEITARLVFIAQGEVNPYTQINENLVINLENILNLIPIRHIYKC